MHLSVGPKSKGFGYVTVTDVSHACHAEGLWRVAVVAYVSDYISKPALKTYLIFEAVKSAFDRNSEMLGGSLD